MEIEFLSPWFLYSYVVLLAIVPVRVIYDMLTGRMPLSGLFTAAPSPANPRPNAIDPERLALFGATLAGAGYYLTITFEQMTKAEPHLESLPEMPEEMLIALGLSQSTYVTGKFFRAFNKRSSSE